MATIIRDAVVRIGLQQIPSELKAPDISAITGAQDAIQKALAATRTGYTDLATAIEEQTKATREALAASGVEHQRHSEQVTIGNIKMLTSFSLAGEGAFRFARGLAFVTSDADDDLQKMLQTIASFQGAFDVFKGGTQFIRGSVQAYQALTTSTYAAVTAQLALNAAQAVNPVGLTVLAITAAASAGIVIWNSYGDAGESAFDRINDSARRAQQEFKSTAQQIREANAAFASARNLIDLGQFDDARGVIRQRGNVRPGPTGFRDEPFARRALQTIQREGGIDPDRDRRLLAEAELRLGRAVERDDLKVRQQLELKNLEQERARGKLTELETQEKLIQSRQRELSITQDLLKAEQDKVLSIQAQLGARDAGERGELKRLAERVAAGEQLTARQAERFGQLGGDLTRGFAQEQLSNLGKDFAEELARILGTDVRGRQRELQDSAGRAEQELFDATNGLAPQTAIQRIIQQRQQIEAEAKSAMDAISVDLKLITETLVRHQRLLTEVRDAQL